MPVTPRSDGEMGVEIDAVWIRGDDGDVVGIAIFGTDGTRNDGGLVRTSPDDGNPGVGTARVAVDGSRGEDSGTGFTACSPAWLGEAGSTHFPTMSRNATRSARRADLFPSDRICAIVSGP